MNTESAPQPVWAVVELMGHVRYGGLVSKDSQLGTPLIRVDIPQEDGSFVSQLVNPSAIYRLTMCEEAIARAAARHGDHKPMDQWTLRHLLPGSSEEETE